MLKSDPDNAYVIYSMNSVSMITYIKEVTEYTLNNYEPKASSFSCCSRYLECSDAKRCILGNQLYSKACTYRKNLDSGKIFYGINRNID